jgi:hypothetical protein
MSKIRIIRRYKLPQSPVLKGLGSIMDIYGSHTPISIVSIYKKTIEESLSGDWEAVRGDLVKSYYREINGKVG